MWNNIAYKYVSKENEIVQLIENVNKHLLNYNYIVMSIQYVNERVSNENFSFFN